MESRIASLENRLDLLTKRLEELEKRLNLIERPRLQTAEFFQPRARESPKRSSNYLNKTIAAVRRRYEGQI